MCDPGVGYCCLDIDPKSHFLKTLMDLVEVKKFSQCQRHMYENEKTNHQL